MPPIIEVPFSELINKPKDTVEELVRASARHIRLRRRNAEDLMLTTASRYEQDHDVVVTAVRLLVAVVRDDSAVALTRRVFPEVFPWVRFLPDQETEAFMQDLLATLRAVEDLDNYAPVAQLIVEWRHTAEVYADPALHATLSQQAGDFGPVPEPEAA